MSARGTMPADTTLTLYLAARSVAELPTDSAGLSAGSECDNHHRSAQLTRLRDLAP